MGNILPIITIVLSSIIVILILVQGGGAGLGSAWGGSGEQFQTRRGIEKWTVRATIFFVVLFFIISIINLLI